MFTLITGLIGSPLMINGYGNLHLWTKNQVMRVWRSVCRRNCFNRKALRILYGCPFAKEGLFSIPQFQFSGATWLGNRLEADKATIVRTPSRQSEHAFLDAVRLPFHETLAALGPRVSAGLRESGEQQQTFQFELLTDDAQRMNRVSR